jgi:hypothetical protein
MAVMNSLVKRFSTRLKTKRLFVGKLYKNIVQRPALRLSAEPLLLQGQATIANSIRHHVTVAIFYNNDTATKPSNPETHCPYND